MTLVDAVHQIWLAGLGALARAQKQGPKAFESIIHDGASFMERSRGEAEKQVRDAISAVQSAVEVGMQTGRDQATETWDNLEKIFQARVQRVLHQVGVPSASDVATLTKRVAALNASVEALARSRGAASARRAPRGQRAVRRATRARPAAQAHSGGLSATA
jgi:poly(hydroxyalkanoate) granule-associated protein